MRIKRILVVGAAILLMVLGLASSIFEQKVFHKDFDTDLLFYIAAVAVTFCSPTEKESENQSGHDA